MRVKVSGTIVTFPKDGKFVIYNYLSKEAVLCGTSDVYWLTVAPDWTTVEDILERHPEIDANSLRQQIDQLVDCGILVAEGTPQADAEAGYTKSWEFGLAAAVFHFTVTDAEFSDLEESVRRQKSKMLVEPSPDLYWRASDSCIRLPDQARTTSRPLFSIMERRRSQRTTLGVAITIEDLSECLYAGLGMTSLVKTEVGLLPLKMTPSGGARNPFEAFVMVRSVSGLAPGVYHYSAFDHALDKVAELPDLPPRDLVKGQDWADNMSAIVFLVAMMRRTTWKYNDPNAYRVILIEAGHIAQNIMLACTNGNLTACPTAALAHSKIKDMLRLDDISETPIYALLIGKPAASTDTYVSLDSFRRFAA